MPACLPLGASVNGGRLQAGRRLGRSSLSSFEAGLDEANHLVHEFEQFGGAGGSRQGLGLMPRSRSSTALRQMRNLLGGRVQHDALAARALGRAGRTGCCNRGSV